MSPCDSCVRLNLVGVACGRLHSTGAHLPQNVAEGEEGEPCLPVRERQQSWGWGGWERIDSQLLVGHVMEGDQFAGELAGTTQTQSRAGCQEKDRGVQWRQAKGAEDWSKAWWEGPGGVACGGEHRQHSLLQLSLQRTSIA